MEQSGVATVGFISKTFEHDFQTSAKVFGVPGLPYVIVAERALPTMGPDEIGRRVEGVVDQVIDRLTAFSPSAAEGASHEELVNLGTTLFGLEVPDTEIFEGSDQLDAWSKMNATYLERGWGDGFPLVPATPELVGAMLTGTKRSPQETIAVLEPCFGIATVEKLAVNAVMAGCKPEHLPVLIAAVEAISDPLYELRHVAMSTSPYTPMLVINGPIVQRIGLNSGMACLGPGAPSAVNNVIGRALRLILMNVSGNYVGITDLDTLGDPNKYSMCLAEREEENPWEPLHVERGYRKDQSTVTAFVANVNITHADHYTTEPVPFLRRLASVVCNPGVTATGWWMGRPQKDINPMDLKPDDYDHDCLIILCPNHARMLALQGWAKPGVKEALHLFAKMPVREGPGLVGTALLRYGNDNSKVRNEWGWLADYPDLEVPAYRSPDSYQIIVAGADSQKSMVVLGGKKAITRLIEE